MTGWGLGKIFLGLILFPSFTQPQLLASGKEKRGLGKIEGKGKMGVTCDKKVICICWDKKKERSDLKGEFSKYLSWNHKIAWYLKQTKQYLSMSNELIPT